MATRKGTDFDLIKVLLEEAGLSTLDVITRIIQPGCSAASCIVTCATCHSGCSSGPAARLEGPTNISFELDQLKREILAELKRFSS